MKLLIADDELSTRILLRHCAARWGYEVIEAADGLEAMSLLRGPEPPRIAVLDWMMPGLDGVESSSTTCVHTSLKELAGRMLCAA